MTKLGILLTTSPENGNTNTVIKLSRAALGQGVEVSIFLMADGIYNINKDYFLELLEEGAEISVCAHNASKRKVERVDGINFGSQYDLAIVANESDRFISF